MQESDRGESAGVRAARKKNGQQVTFHGFVSVYNRLMGQERRLVRLDVKNAFEKLQVRFGLTLLTFYSLLPHFLLSFA